VGIASGKIASVFFESSWILEFVAAILGACIGLTIIMLVWFYIERVLGKTKRPQWTRNLP
jgi:hypothetical protein